MDRAKRDECLILLKQNGLSCRQIERLTGINRGVIQRVSEGRDVSGGRFQWR
jgi:transposase-like protein